MKVHLVDSLQGFDLKLCFLFTMVADFLTDTQPDLKLAFAKLNRSNSSSHVREDDMYEDDMILPEAFTQLGVGSPGNTSTGMLIPPSLHHGRRGWRILAHLTFYPRIQRPGTLRPFPEELRQGVSA